jgi:hypothetical protein
MSIQNSGQAQLRALSDDGILGYQIQIQIQIAGAASPWRE